MLFLVLRCILIFEDVFVLELFAVFDLLMVEGTFVICLAALDVGVFAAFHALLFEDDFVQCMAELDARFLLSSTCYWLRITLFRLWLIWMQGLSGSSWSSSSVVMFFDFLMIGDVSGLDFYRVVATFEDFLILDWVSFFDNGVDDDAVTVSKQGRLDCSSFNVFLQLFNEAVLDNKNDLLTFYQESRSTVKFQ